jgi:hypothetical protein
VRAPGAAGRHSSRTVPRLFTVWPLLLTQGGTAKSLGWSVSPEFVVTYVSVDVVVFRSVGSALDQVGDRRMVGVCEVQKRVRGRCRRGVIPISVVLVCGRLDLVARPAIRPPQERLDASGSGSGAAEQRCLVGSQPVAERVEPSLLDVGTAVVGGKVNKDGQDVVVQVLQVRKQCLAVPRTVVVQVG